LKLLIVKISSLGDVVHGIAFANALTAGRSDVTVDWVAGDAYVNLLKEVRGVRRVIPFKRKSWGAGWYRPSVAREIFSFIREIRRERYDICLDLQGLLRSGLITLFSGAGMKAGFADAREGSGYLYGKTITPAEEKHAVKKLFRALELFEVPEPEQPDFSFNIPAESEAAVGTLLKKLGVQGSFAVFHPGARWFSKMWPEERWRELAETAHENTGLPILFTGSKDDRVTIEKIIGNNGRFMFNVAGETDLTSFSALVKRAEFMVTVDSGPMHIASAFNVPMVALFGPTSPEKTGPLTKAPLKILQSKADCVPCFRKKCDIGYRCMKDITAQTAVSAIRDIRDE